jgi:formyl-CoA transferase/succinyl-CoA--D-citramalate CoA-transferase
MASDLRTSAEPAASSPSGPLAGVRILELGSFVAGPFAGQLLADYGADVIKVEPPGAGDRMRTWGHVHDGEGLWWPTISRNKRSVAIDLRQPEGAELVRRLARECDAIVENFRTGQLESWGLGYDVLSADNPGLVLVHVSGYGRTGPRAGEAGFGSIAEAMGGIRHTTGEAGRPSSRAGISLGDAIGSLFAVIGLTSALVERGRSGRGQEVDVALYEAVAALMESSFAEHEVEGITRGRSGGVLPGVAPSNGYPTKDGAEVLIAGNADTVFRRLCDAMGEPELADDERYATHDARGRNADELDERIARWTVARTTDELLEVLTDHGVPAGRIYTAADAVQDPHFLAREMVLRMTSSTGLSIPMTGVVPKFGRTPGIVRHAGPTLGAHTDDVIGALTDIGPEGLAALRDRRVIE